MGKYVEALENFSGKCHKRTAYAVMGIMVWRIKMFNELREKTRVELSSEKGFGKERQLVERMERCADRATALRQLLLDIDEWCDEQGFEND